MTTSTYEATPPARPVAADLGRDDLQDDVEYPPDPETMPTADGHNQKVLSLVGLESVTPWAILTVHFSGTTATLHKMYCKRASVVPGDFTVTRTSSGVITVAWDLTLAPTPIADHVARGTGATAHSPTVEMTGTGCTVRTSGDYPFVLELF